MTVLDFVILVKSEGRVKNLRSDSRLACGRQGRFASGNDNTHQSSLSRYDGNTQASSILNQLKIEKQYD
jgi:hypothetical protein